MQGSMKQNTLRNLYDRFQCCLLLFVPSAFFFFCLFFCVSCLVLSCRKRDGHGYRLLLGPLCDRDTHQLEPGGVAILFAWGHPSTNILKKGQRSRFAPLCVLQIIVCSARVLIRPRVKGSGLGLVLVRCLLLPSWLGPPQSIFTPATTMPLAGRLVVRGKLYSGHLSEAYLSLLASEHTAKIILAMIAGAVERWCRVV